MNPDEIKWRAALPFCCVSHSGTLGSGREHILNDLAIGSGIFGHAVRDLVLVYRTLIAHPETAEEERADLQRRLEQIEGVYLSLMSAASWLELALYFAVPQVPAQEAAEPSVPLPSEDKSAALVN